MLVLDQGVDSYEIVIPELGVLIAKDSSPHRCISDIAATDAESA